MNVIKFYHGRTDSKRNQKALFGKTCIISCQRHVRSILMIGFCLTLLTHFIPEQVSFPKKRKTYSSLLKRFQGGDEKVFIWLLHPQRTGGTTICSALTANDFQIYASANVACAPCFCSNPTNIDNLGTVGCLHNMYNKETQNALEVFDKNITVLEKFMLTKGCNATDSRK